MESSPAAAPSVTPNSLLLFSVVLFAGSDVDVIFVSNVNALSNPPLFIGTLAYLRFKISFSMAVKSKRHFGTRRNEELIISLEI